MKKIVVMPVKNEEWILEKSLACASLWADHIIVADQQSTDRTPDICRQFEKVVYVENTCPTLDQSVARQLLLNTSRELFGLDTVICALDADEILSANCFQDRDFNALLDHLERGQSVVLQWVMLWGAPDRYRDDNSVWGNSWKHFIFRDDGRTSFSQKATSEPRMPEAFMQSFVRYDAVKVLHYQFVNWARMLAKQRRYRVYDYLEQPTFIKALRVNNVYAITRNVRDEVVDTTPIPGDWLFGYSNVDLRHFPDEVLYWYEVDVLRQFARLGEHYFKWLDIWDIDWEDRRRSAIANGVYNISRHTIDDPRNFFIRIYHKYEDVVHKFLKSLLSVIHEAYSRK